MTRSSAPRGNAALSSSVNVPSISTKATSAGSVERFGPPVVRPALDDNIALSEHGLAAVIQQQRDLARHHDPVVDGLGPVSYTHLDVYKRQPPRDVRVGVT